MVLSIDDSYDFTNPPTNIINSINALATQIKKLANTESWLDDISSNTSLNPNWLVKHNNFIGVANNKYFITSSCSLALPNNPTIGDGIAIFITQQINSNSVVLQSCALNGVNIKEGYFTESLTNLIFNGIFWESDGDIDIILFSSPYYQSILEDAPWAYYRLNDIGDIALDASGNDRNGIYRNEYQIIDGSIADDEDKAVSFINPGRIHIPYQIAPASQYSYEFKIKTIAISVGLIDFSYDAEINSSIHGRQLDIDYAGRLAFYSFGVVLTSNKIINDNQWHIITIALGSRGLELWIDRLMDSSISMPTSDYTFLGYWRIGFGQGISKYVGALDEVSIYDYQLPVERILVHHTN